VVIDESGRKLFKYQLASYLRKNMNSFDNRHIHKMQDSKRNNLLQLVDMVCGAVNRSFSINKKDNQKFRNVIRSREIDVQIWPK